MIGLLHLLVSKLAHYIIEWVRDHKLMNKGLLSHLLVVANLDLEALSQHPLLRPISFKTLFLKLIELLVVFFYNGNILLLSWCFSGQVYSYVMVGNELCERCCVVLEMCCFEHVINVKV